MNLKYALIASLLSVAACAPHPKQETKAAKPAQPTEAVTEDRITAIITCIKADKCNAPVQTVKVSDGDVMHMVTGDGTNGFTYRYFYTDNLRFGVIISDKQLDTLMVEDDDLNGKVDRIGVGTRDKGSREGPIDASNPNYGWTQQEYLRSMNYVDQIVPKKLMDSIKQLPHDQ